MFLFFWILSSVALGIKLLLSSCGDNKADRQPILSANSSFTTSLGEGFPEPQERINYLNQKINTKLMRLQVSRNKINETKKTISELEMTSEQIKSKYNGLLKDLKAELAKTEAECKKLSIQIHQISGKRDKLKTELDEKYNKVSLPLDELF